MATRRVKVNRQFLMLAKTYVGQRIAGWYCSEKLDGLRAYWDGGITRGMTCADVCFANIGKGGGERLASGLWTRLGKPVHAPDWFLDGLPEVPLDGELWAGRAEWETASSVVRTYDSSTVDWKKIRYLVFDSPTCWAVFEPGRINETHFKKQVTDFERSWVLSRQQYLCITGVMEPFDSVYRKLVSFFRSVEGKRVGGWVELLEQDRLPTGPLGMPEKELMLRLERVTAARGEGLMLRNPASYWMPQRMDGLLKVKAEDDDEAVVIGYTWGRRTDLGSKLLGKMGALIVQWKHVAFELSGFTDEEREMACRGDSVVVRGEKMEGERETDPAHYYARHFELGTVVTFKYNGLTKAGIPKSARFFRKE